MSTVVSLLLAIGRVLSDVPQSFDYTSNENGQNIGWIEVFSCDEAASGSEQTFANGLDGADYFEYFPEAIAIQILPNGLNPTDFDFDGSSTGSFAVMTDICSIPVIALNNNLDLSWPISPDTLSSTGSIADSTYIDNNWLGTDEAKDRYIQYGCTARDPSAIYDSSSSDNDYLIYWACGNHDGAHISQSSCSLDYQTDLAGLENITMYLGFDLNKKDCCVVNDDGDTQLTQCPSLTTTTTTTTSEPTADCSLSLRDYLDECVCEEGFNRGRFSRSEAAQIEKPSFIDYNNQRYNDQINPNDMVKLILPSSVFYVLLILVIIGVVAICGGSAFFIRKVVENQSYSKNVY